MQEDVFSIITVHSRPTFCHRISEQAPSTKDPNHQRRVSRSVGPVVNFTPEMVTKLKKKKEFLANTVNKQRFVSLLSDALDNSI